MNPINFCALIWHERKLFHCAVQYLKCSFVEPLQSCWSLSGSPQTCRPSAFHGFSLAINTSLYFSFCVLLLSNAAAVAAAAASPPSDPLTHCGSCKVKVTALLLVTTPMASLPFSTGRRHLILPSLKIDSFRPRSAYLPPPDHCFLTLFLSHWWVQPRLP